MCSWSLSTAIEHWLRQLLYTCHNLCNSPEWCFLKMRRLKFMVVVLLLLDIEPWCMENSCALLLCQATVLGIGKADNAELPSTDRNLLFCLSALSASIRFASQSYTPPHRLLPLKMQRRRRESCDLLRCIVRDHFTRHQSITTETRFLCENKWQNNSLVTTLFQTGEERWWRGELTINGGRWKPRRLLKTKSKHLAGAQETLLFVH